MKLLTTKKERSIVMEQLRPVSKLEKILFPVIVTVLVSLLLPDAAPLIGMLMLGKPDAGKAAWSAVFRIRLRTN